VRKSNKIFLIAGRTGGPIIPLLAIFRNLEKIQQKEISELKSLIQELTENNLKVSLESDLNIQNSQSNLETKNSEISLKLPQNSLEKFEKLQKELNFKIANQFEGLTIGVKNGFETKLVIQENLAIEFLPEAKLEILSFRLNLRTWKDFWEFLTNFGKFLKVIMLLIWSFCLSFWFIFKHRPVAILSSGSFLAIPVVWSSSLVNFFNSFFHFFPKIKIITHGQDPLPGVASRLTFGFGHIKSCVFDYSRKFIQFKNAEIIPNPLNFGKFEPTKNEIINILQKNPKFSKFLKSSVSKIDK